MFFKKFWKKSPPDIKDTLKEKQSSQAHLSVIIQDFWHQVKKSEQSLNELELIDIMENINKLLDENQLDVIAEITVGGILRSIKLFLPRMEKLIDSSI